VYSVCSQVAIEHHTARKLLPLESSSYLPYQDILFVGGLVHVVDTVLTIPMSFPATITGAGLSNLVALLNKGGWLSNASQILDLVDDQSDLTM
jgi:hypothetical protein